MDGTGAEHHAGTNRFSGFVCQVFAVALFVTVQALVVWPYVVRGASDFSRYLEAGRAVLEGRSPYFLYDFDYPALIAFLAAPLSVLSSVTAHVLWYTLNLGLFVVSGALTWRLMGGGRLAGFIVVMLWGLGGEVAETLALGQLNIVLLVLVLLWWDAASRSPGLRASALGLAVGLKLWPGALTAMHLLAGSRRLAVRALSVAVILVAGPWVAVRLFLAGPAHPSSSWYWAGTPSIFNMSIPAIILRILVRPGTGGGLPPSWILGNTPAQLHIDFRLQIIACLAGLLVLGAGVLGLTFMAVKGRLDVEDPRVHAGLLSLVLATAPIVWHHYHMLQLPGIALLSYHHARWRRGGLALAVAGVGLMLTWLHGLGLRPYLAAFGWSGKHVVLLWGLTTAPAVLSLLLALALVHSAVEYRSSRHNPDVP